jgi:hypothetical protein
VVDTLRVVDVDAETRRREQLDGQHLDAGHASLHLRGDLCLQLAFLPVTVRLGHVFSKKRGAGAPISELLRNAV